MYDFYSPDDPTEIIRDWVAHSLDEVKHCGGVNVRPLYTAPPQREWRSLTSAQTKVLWNLTKKPTEYAAMIDAKLRELNHGRPDTTDN